MESQSSNTKKFKVLFFPWLGTAHIAPYIELAKILSKHQHFQAFFCSTSINLTSIKNTLKNNSRDFPIEFVELHLPEVIDFPPHLHTTKNLPPHLHPTLMDAFQKSQPSFAEILNDLKPDLVIYDMLQPWAAKLALSMNIACIHLYICSAASCSFFTYHSTRWSKDNNDVKGSYPFPEIQNSEAKTKRTADLPSDHTHDIPNLCYTSITLSTKFVLLNTSNEIEGKYMEHCSSLFGKKFVPLGPLVQEAVSLDSHSHIIEWLESKTPSSVVFVSFGSEYFLSKEEIEEVANGLDLSNANFLWAIKISDGKTTKQVLPQGFLERMKNRGLVVDGWVPQARILKHPNTGGFLSHCGWNSLIESFYFCVPVIAIPIQYDQTVNARLIVGLGLGAEAERDEHGRFDRVNIANAIKKVMGEKDGEFIRKKATDLKDKLEIEKEVNINAVLQELLNVCQQR